MGNHPAPGMDPMLRLFELADVHQRHGQALATRTDATHSSADTHAHATDHATDSAESADSAIASVFSLALLDVWK